MQCPSCKFENMPGRDQCCICGSSLSAVEPESIYPPRKRDKSAGERFLWWMRQPRHWPEIKLKIPYWARQPSVLTVEWWQVGLSIIPGYAHCFLFGDLVPGIGLLLLSVAAMAAAVSYPGTIVGGTGTAVVLSLSILCVFTVINRYSGNKRQGLHALLWRAGILVLILASYQVIYMLCAICFNISSFLQALFRHY